MKELEEAFQQTYKTLFGECNQKMEDLHDYLLKYQYNLPIYTFSKETKKPITMCSPNYSKGANFISYDEIDFSKKYEPIGINQIKDIDSLIGQFHERFNYAGNKVFGNSQKIENSDNCTDSYFVQNSHNIESSKYVAYSAYVRTNSEYIFGCSHMITGKHKIKFVGGANNSRCFESYLITNCSDAYFSFYCHGCSDIMFSFNSRSKRHCIGNSQLEKSKYLQIKKELLEQMREYLEKHREFYSIFDFAPPKKEDLQKLHPPIAQDKPGNLAPIEDSFKIATKIILGRELTPVDKYEKFLSGRIEKIKSTASPFGSKLHYSDYFINKNVPKERMINEHEAAYLSTAPIGFKVEPGEQIPKILQKLSSIAFYPAHFREGSDENNTLCPYVYHASDGYKISDNTLSKKSAYCIHPHSCEAIFGCGVLMVNCKYCIRCHNSTKLTACMDCDSCSNCANCLFCHNCENLENCMFCFNTKAKRYSIANVEVGKEKYEKIRKMVCTELLSRIEKTGSIGFDIYNLGQYRGNK